MNRACFLEWLDSSIGRPAKREKVALPTDEIGDHLQPERNEMARTFEGTMAQLGSGARSLGRSCDGGGP
jgi:hypothetical protein